MKKTISIFLLTTIFLCQALALFMFKVSAEGTDFYVRVEGLTGTIAFGSFSEINAMAAAEKLLVENNIEYSALEHSFTEINGLKNGKLDSSQWSYYVKSIDSRKPPKTELDSYFPAAGEEIVIYYTDSTVPHLNSVEIEKGEERNVKISFNSGDEGIAGVLATIDGKNYITGDNGAVDFPEGLSSGIHTYRISGYNSGSLSSVVMDQGTFTLDDMEPASINYMDTQYKLAEDDNDLIKAAAVYIKDYADPFAYVSLDKLSMDKNLKYLSSAYDRIKNYGVDSCSTGELENIIIAAAAAGYSPYDFADCSVPAVLYSRSINTFGTDDLIFGLIAMNYAGIQDTYYINRSLLKEKLLERELTEENNTGWSLGDSVDPYITGAAISALSQYYEEAAVRTAVDNAVKTLNYLQDDEGFIKGNGGMNSETQAFVITGLISVGINPEGITYLQEGTRVNFAKPDGTLFSAMLSFIQEDGSFRRTIHGSSNKPASEQCLRALISLYNYKYTGNAYDYYISSSDSSALKIFRAAAPEKTGVEIIKSGNTAVVVSQPVISGNSGKSTGTPDKSNNGKQTKSNNRIYISVGGLILIIGIIGVASQAVNRRD